MWMLIIAGAVVLLANSAASGERDHPPPLEVFGFALLAAGLFAGALHP